MKMDYKELIEELRNYSYWLGQSGPESHEIKPVVCGKAADAIETLLEDLDAAVGMMHGDCHYCKNLGGWHNIGKCKTCKHESESTFMPEDYVVHINDNWEWRGPDKKKENSP